MNADAISRLGAVISTVEEVETNEDGECIGEFARVRIKVDITKPLKKIIFWNQREKKYQYQLCMRDSRIFVYVAELLAISSGNVLSIKIINKKQWLKAMTLPEHFNHFKPKERWNRSNNTRKEEYSNQECHENQQQSQKRPDPVLGNGLETIQSEAGESTAPMSEGHVAVVVDEQLMLEGINRDSSHSVVKIRTQ